MCKLLSYKMEIIHHHDYFWYKLPKLNLDCVKSPNGYETEISRMDAQFHTRPANNCDKYFLLISICYRPKLFSLTSLKTALSLWMPAFLSRSLVSCWLPTGVITTVAICCNSKRNWGVYFKVTTLIWRHQTGKPSENPSHFSREENGKMGMPRCSIFA